MNDMKFEEWWERYSRNDFRRSDEIARDAWAEAVKTHQLLIDAARKAVRCRRNGQWRNLEDAVLLMEVALKECRRLMRSNAPDQRTGAEGDRSGAATGSTSNGNYGDQ